jgi:hypothetical protein
VKRYPKIGEGETKNDENRQCGSRRRNGSVAWCGFAADYWLVAWVTGNDFRPATCVDGASALGLQQCYCAGVGSPAVWVAQGSPGLFNFV